MSTGAAMARHKARDVLSALGARLAGVGRIGRVAIAAALLWAVLVVSYGVGYFGGTGGQARGTAFLDAVFFLVALLLPIGLVGLAAWMAVELARLRAMVGALAEAAAPLAAALEETRATLAGTTRDGGPAPSADAARLEAVLREVAANQRALAQEVGRLAGARPATPDGAGNRRGPPPVPQSSPAGALARGSAGATEGQPALPSIALEPEEAIEEHAVIRALDFPRDPEDREGFRALKRALRHHGLAQLLQAAEDVMNLLSQEGLYMEDLKHQPAQPALWRAFATGRRGAETAAVGGIRDPHALEVVRGLMKSDPIFRDTALYFQRRFDAMLRDFAPRASDAALAALADTRSARAFMLCARASGTFGQDETPKP